MLGWQQCRSHQCPVTEGHGARSSQLRGVLAVTEVKSARFVETITASHLAGLRVFKFGSKEYRFERGHHADALGRLERPDSVGHAGSEKGNRRGLHSQVQRFFR